MHLISFHLLTPIDTRLSYHQPFTFPVLLLYIIKTVKISSKVLTAHQHACIIHHLLSVMTDIKTDKYQTDKHCPVESSTPKRSTATPCCGYVKEIISMSKASFLWSTVLYHHSTLEQDILNGPSVAALHELQRTPIHHTSSHSLLIWYDLNICPLFWHRFICTLHRRYILPSVHLLISHVSLLFRYSLTYWLLSRKSGFANQSFI